MTTKILHNPTINAPIHNFRIEEAQFDAQGQIMKDNEGNYLKTGRTLEWSLECGETLEFPAYVADYLKSIYGFLDEKQPVATIEPISEPEPVSEEPVVAKAKTGNVSCKACGLPFGNERALGLHVAARHPELIIKA